MIFNGKNPYNPSQESILAIKTLFSDERERSTELLSNFYKDEKILVDVIRGIMFDAQIDISRFANSSVLIKPNWVIHNRKPKDKECLTTHPRFILAILDIVLETKPTEVIIADAPLQSCKWDKLLPEYFLVGIKQREIENSIPIRIIDWRRRIFVPTENLLLEERRDLDDYIIFDVKGLSYLDPITTEKPIFRVTDYDPDRLSESHKKGKHLYCIAKEVFEVDHIIAIPKAKTHQKTGITNALKLMVGLNGDKDYLPHHRVGGTGFGGDCYPGANLVRRLTEHVLDMANRRIGKPTYRPLRLLSRILWHSVPSSPKHSYSAAWYGNDTCWRMVMDLNMIAKFGKRDGSISSESQRNILYVCDGIIGGQGNGPTNPDPLPLGVIMVSENPAKMDYALALLMRFDPYKLPLISNALSLFGDDTQMALNGKSCELDEIVDLSIFTKAAPGWVDYIQDSLTFNKRSG